MIKDIFNKNSTVYFILFFTCVIFGFIILLFLTNNLLANKIAKSKKHELTMALTQNLDCSNYKTQVLDKKTFYYCPYSSKIALHSFSNGYVEKIEYVASLDIKNNNVKNISILSHKETPGLGDKIANKEWLKNLYNKNIKHLWLKRDNGSVDSFTAASITPTMFLTNLRQNINWLNHNKNKIKEKIYSRQ